MPSAGNTPRDLQNPSDDTKAKSNNYFIIDSLQFKLTSLKHAKPRSTLSSLLHLAVQIWSAPAGYEELAGTFESIRNEVKTRRFRSVHWGVVVSRVRENFLTQARVSAAIKTVKGWLKLVKKETWSHSGRCLVRK